jgi:hypothetical protein
MNEHDEALLDRLEMERTEAGRALPGSPLAKARMKAHNAFDRFWLSGKMSRKQAYKWLARAMGIPRERCHMVMFSEGDCEEVVRLCSLKAFQEEEE